ncbi:hypothetical protein L5515_001602 [Caenorhabditis briggsae]|uniref:Uncharacterized protein n=1 Tax=Caenorhabditis briggsae TaxID=6238 RepID=A0AAE9E564_CAEBR|nr:hypothetical protein L5515_001602 [Caenorhabditis briggsae]
MICFSYQFCWFHFQSASSKSFPLVSVFIPFLASHLSKKKRLFSRIMKHLNIDKADSLQPEHVHITANGLRPGGTYRFDMQLRHNYGSHASYCVLKADENGNIDMKTAKPLRGTYFEADGMGLFLSMTPCEDFAYGGYLRCTPPIPFFYLLILSDESGTKLDEMYIKKHWMHPLLTRTEIEHDGFCGTLFKPPGDGPFPCVMDISGTGGGLHEHKGAMLASEGFVVICVAFFQFKDLPYKMEDVDVEYFLKPIEFVLGLPYTTNMLGIQGVSFGATIVDLLSTRYPQIKAVVSINGPHAQSHYCLLKEHGKPMDVPYLDDSKLFFINTILATAPCFKTLTPVLTPENSIPWHRIPKDTAYRLIGSVDDLCAPSIHSNLHIQKKLQETGHYVELELVNGGHIMEPPYFPHHDIVYAKFQGFYCGYGGEIVLHAKSQERTWANTINFFKRKLGSPPPMPDWMRLTKVDGPLRPIVNKNENRSRL